MAALVGRDVSKRAGGKRRHRGGPSNGPWRYLCAVSFVIYAEAAIDAAVENHCREEQK